VGERLTQVCRISCGGHGFLVASGLVNIKNVLDGACSAEGDNVVLFQQTARYDSHLSSFNLYFYVNRYLLKVIQQADEDNGENIDSSVGYLHLPVWSSRTIINLDDYCRLFESRSQL
jgi:hypothetical protein